VLSGLRQTGKGCAILVPFRRHFEEASRLTIFAVVRPPIRIIIRSGIPAATVRKTSLCRRVWKPGTA
jgi:hypothetical protein